MLACSFSFGCLFPFPLACLSLEQENRSRYSRQWNRKEGKKREKEAIKKRKETIKGRAKQKMHITAESCWTQRNNAVSNLDVWTFPNPISAKTASHCNGALALRTAWRLSARNRVPRSLHRLKLGCTQTARRLHASKPRGSFLKLNAFIGDAPREKIRALRLSPPTSYSHCPRVRVAVVLENAVARCRARGCVGGFGVEGQGIEGCTPFLRHYVIRRFSGDSHGVNPRRETSSTAFSR